MWELFVFFFFFKQKTAYEMRISDWSSDVCSSDLVEKGQLLAQIDPTVFQARVTADQANMLALRAQRTDKQVQQGLAEKQYERQKRLLGERATSQDAYDSAEANRRSLLAQIAVLDAQIQQAEATLSSDQANLGYTKNYAPMTGTVEIGRAHV